jgi:gamma-glutamylcysteine synthetase
MNSASFIVVALCGNSSVYNSSVTPAVSYRESHLQELLVDDERHGPCDKVADIEDLVSVISKRQHFIFSRLQGYHKGAGTFDLWLKDCSAYSDNVMEEYLFHDHYNWNCARLRPRVGTIEMRAACQLPPALDGASSALYLGLVALQN